MKFQIKLAGILLSLGGAAVGGYYIYKSGGKEKVENPVETGNPVQGEQN